MKRTSLLLRSLLCANAVAVALSVGCLAQGARPFQINGVVVSERDGSPVPFCRLSATLESEAGSQTQPQNRRMARRPRTDAGDQNSTLADARGNFSLTVPSAGRWQLSASARGFVTQVFDEHDGFSSSVVLRASHPTETLTFRLPPEGRITGIVLDEAGDPVRSAQIALYRVQAPVPGTVRAAPTPRGFATTDDRGRYKLAGLAPGQYRLSAQARPWYATAGQPMNGSATDSTLDVIYPPTWFPGVTEPEVADTLVVKGGDNLNAEFHLLPTPAVHLRLQLPVPAAQENGAGPRPRIFPQVQRVGSFEAGMSGMSVSMTSGGPRSEVDVGGLGPGLYQVNYQGGNQPPALIRVTADSQRTLEVLGASDFATVSVHLDGLPDPGRLQIVFTNPDTGEIFQTSGPGNTGLRRRGPAAPRTVAQEDPPQNRVPQDTTVALPPGTYQVTLAGDSQIFLTGITGEHAETSGRLVKVAAGDAKLTLHVASGRATLSGTVMTMTAAGDLGPDQGAQVLVIPATMGDPGSITVLRRDQSNTDGSFDIPDLIPGEYILVAIDHGWNVNWSDPATLERYLTRGIPIAIKAGTRLTQTVEAQKP